MSNPYFGNTFWSFFITLFTRLPEIMRGAPLTSDEIQFFTLSSLAASCSLVGTFLVLRKRVMLANSLSHTILLGIVLVAFFTTPSTAANAGTNLINLRTLLIAAFCMGLLTTYLTQFTHKVLRLPIDASIGVIFTSLFAIGIIAATLLTRDSHIGLETVMGSADLLSMDDLQLATLLLSLNLVLTLLFFKGYQITSFDPGYAHSIGFNLSFYHYLIMVQVAATAIAAFRAVGVLMVLTLFCAPPLTARLLTDRLKRVLLFSILIGSAASLIGVALSRHLLTAYNRALSTGGIVVSTALLFFFLAAIRRYTNQKG